MLKTTLQQKESDAIWDWLMHVDASELDRLASELNCPCDAITIADSIENESLFILVNNIELEN